MQAISGLQIQKYVTHDSRSIQQQWCYSQASRIKTQNYNYMSSDNISMPSNSERRQTESAWQSQY